MGIASGVLTIANFGADGTDGYLIDATDQWIIREYVGSTNDALTDVPAAQQRATFNMRHYLTVVIQLILVLLLLLVLTLMVMLLKKLKSLLEEVTVE